MESERIKETYKSLITISVENFRYLALLNGGAIVAILSSLKDKQDLLSLKPAFVCFIVGLLSLGIAMMLSYLTQLTLLNEEQGTSTDGTPHYYKLWLAIVACFISLICFVLGSCNALNS